MKILHFDILEGFKKGGITQFENDNLNETYKIYLYKNKMRFDVDGKTIRFIMLDKNKAGQVLTLRKGEASNEIILPVTKELTKIDGTYDAQIIFTKADGYNEKTIPFRVTIKNDLLTDMESELVSREEYQYLVDRFEEAVRNIENFKTEIRNEYSGMETDLNDKYILFKDEVNNSNNSFKNEIGSQVTENEKNISDNAKDIERAFETINDNSFIPFEGQNISIEHSKVGYTKDMQIEGMTYQNLLPLKGLRNVSNSLKTNNINLLKTNTEYTMIVKICNSVNNPIGLLGRFWYKDGTVLQIADNTTLDNGIYKFKFTLTKEVESFEYGWIRNFASGMSYEYEYIVLEGDCTQTNAYIPNYFEGVKNVGEVEENKISISSIGKNIFNYELYKKLIKDINGVVLQENGFIADCDKVGNVGNALLNKTQILKGHFKDNTQHLFSYDVIKEGTFEGDFVYKYTDGTSSNCNFVSKEGKTIDYIGFTFFTQANGGKTTFKNLMLTEGTIKPTYEPYKQNRKEILLPFEGGLKGINNFKDTIEIREDSVYALERIIKVPYQEGDESLENCITDKINSYKVREQAIEHKIADLNSINLETFKDMTYVSSENEIAPHLSFKAPVDVPATISTLRTTNTMLMAQNSDLQAKNQELEDVNKKQTTKIIELDDTTSFLIEDALTRKLNN